MSACRYIAQRRKQVPEDLVSEALCQALAERRSAAGLTVHPDEVTPGRHPGQPVRRHSL